MASFAQTIVIGNLGRDPEVKYLPSGDAVCNFSVAVTETWKDKSSGERKEDTTWYRVNMFGKLAEIAGQYLKKGSQVHVVGKMRERKWTDKDGTERASWELKADQMTMLGSPSGSGQSSGPSPHQQQKQNGYAPAPAQNSPKPKFDDLGDDIPF